MWIKDQEAYTLIIVLWSLVILAIIFSYLLDEVILENYIIEASNQEKRLRQAALSAIHQGIYVLINDDSIADTKKDSWLEPVIGKYDEITYQIQIEDIGSRLNVNYSKKEILDEIPLFQGNNDFIDGLIAEPYFLKHYFTDEEYFESKDYITTYGRFNIKQDPAKNLVNLLNHLGLSTSDSNIFISKLEGIQEEGKEIEILDEVPLLVEGLDLSTFEKIRPYLTLEGRININLVNPEIINLIVAGEGFELSLAKKLIAYLEGNDINELEDLKNVLSDEEYKQIANHFTTSSYYLKLRAVAILEDLKEYEISCVIIREYDGDSWIIKILSWSEGKSME